MNRIKWKIKKITRFYRKHCEIALGIGVLFLLLIAVAIITLLPPVISDAKQVKEYLGEWYVSSYSASDNTPSGTHNTSSGAYATAGRTCAVDLKNPLVPMGSHIIVEGFGELVVEDYGGFGRYNGGRRAVDIFTDGKGFLLERKIWLLREETEKEKAERIKKAEIKKAKKRAGLREKTDFDFVYDDSLAEWEIITDPDYISGGVVIIDYNILDVVGTEKGLGNKIKTGSSRLSLFCDSKPFTEVIEGAKG